MEKLKKEIRKGIIDPFRPSDKRPLSSVWLAKIKRSNWLATKKIYRKRGGRQPNKDNDRKGKNR